MKKGRIMLILTLFTISIFLTACTGTKAANGQKNDIDKINVGYFPNLSHGAAMVGIEKGFFAEQLKGRQIDAQTFPNGSLFMDALTTGQLDIGYVGPGPVINRYLQGGKVVLIASASKGENVILVRKDSGIKTVKDLKGKIVATPSTGCTHDLILRKTLTDNGLSTEENGGDVKRITAKPATMAGLFEQKQIDAAVVSEPWASLIQEQTGAEILVDWNQVPWKGELPAAVLVVRKDFLEAHPDVVEQFLAGHKKSIQYLQNNKEEAVQIIGKQIEDITGEKIDKNIIASSLQRVQFTDALDQHTMQEFADLSKNLGFIEGDSSLTGLFWNKLSSK